MDANLVLHGLGGLLLLLSLLVLEEGRYTWRYNSALKFLAASLQSFKGATLFVDLPSFPSPSVITGHTLRPDLLLETADKILHILELTIGFETNAKCNAERTLVKNLRKYYQDVKLGHWREQSGSSSFI